MALQGMALEVHLINPQTTTAGSNQIQEPLGGKVPLPLTYKPSERIRSPFGALEMEGARTEIMGARKSGCRMGPGKIPPTWIRSGPG